jgi:hypothetical protein|tara:strand:+ start:380 stop:550 length:171 start_codon:yes stop_codon:yes gene_type:complete
MKDINIEMLTHIKDTLANLINTNSTIDERIDILFDKIKTIEKNVHELQTAVTETLI